MKKWEILILTQPSRVHYRQRLLGLLAPQVRWHAGDALCVFRTFDPRLSLGENRQRMVEGSRAEYINFVDDDDLVALDYVANIWPLLDGIDYVGFQLQCYIDGAPFSKTYHSLRYGGWSQDEKGHYRDLSHLNPIRRELATQACFEGGFGEDQRWGDQLRAKDVVKTEHYVDKILYHYLYRSVKNDDEPIEPVRLV